MARSVFLICLLLSSPANASCDLSDLIGYTVAASKTIEGWIDSDGNKKDGYEGCDYNRVLVFTDGTGLRCTSYHYHYAYRPDAIILVDGPLIKLCVQDELIDVGPLH